MWSALRLVWSQQRFNIHELETKPEEINLKKRRILILWITSNSCISEVWISVKRVSFVCPGLGMEAHLRFLQTPKVPFDLCVPLCAPHPLVNWPYVRAHSLLTSPLLFTPVSLPTNHNPWKGTRHQRCSAEPLNIPLTLLVLVVSTKSIFNCPKGGKVQGGFDEK